MPSRRPLLAAAALALAGPALAQAQPRNGGRDGPGLGEVARSRGLGEARLYTHGRFAANLRLYGRLGYRVDREEEHPQFGMAVHMSKPLPKDGASRPPAA